MRILYNFASRSRPDKFFAAIENITSLARHDDYVILCKIDTDDPCYLEMYEYLLFNRDKKISIAVGVSESKIHAINRSIEKIPDWDILINMSDDMVFTKEGFDLDIIEAFMADDDTFDLFLAPHFPDGYTADKLITMSIMGKDLYERLGCVYRPEYKSLWCDVEFTETVKQLGVYKYIDKDILRHEHPVNNGNIQMDNQYRHTESFYTEDYATYIKRKEINFGL